MEKFIQKILAQSPHDEKTFYALLVFELLKKKHIFSLLESSKELKKELSEFAPSTKKPSFFSTNTSSFSNHEFLKNLQKNNRIQQHILSCPEVDEHVILLSALKCLEDLEVIFMYQKVLKEMLKKQLHKMENCCNDIELIGRKKEIEEISRILNRTFRNNVLIIGPTGVGKTTLAGSAQQYIPAAKMYQLFPGNDIFFDQVVSILSNTIDKKLLFFLDELFTFEVAHIKYLIDNGQIIATANESSYKKFAAEHPHIISKCEIIMLDEPPKEDLEKIVENNQQHIQEHYPIEYQNEFRTELLQLAKQYVSEPSFPAKAISLTEEAVMSAHAQGSEIVTVDILRSIIAQKTNIPIGSLTEMDKKDLSKLPDKLKRKVKGQDEAVEVVARTIQRSRLGFGRKNRPLGSFLFVGPSGVGKTELAKAIAQEVFGDAEAMVRLDMSEFAEAHMVQRLIGSPPGYIGYEEGGQLTNPVKNKPYTLVLLDEIEKGHPRVFDIFLQVLDDGRLTDGQGKKVDFSNSVVVATSNAGIEEILDMVAEGATSEQISKEIKDILSDYFRIEFINRFDAIIIFNALKPKALKEIGKLQIEKLKIELSKRNIGFSISDKTLDHLAKESYDPRYGARGLLRMLQDSVENKLAEMIINGELKEGQRIEF